MIVDCFAGPGGWDVGAAMLGRCDVVGLEWDDAACRTAKAAGHARIRCDVAQYPTQPLAGVEGLIASPPCQAWSMAGKRKGELDRAHCHALADRMAGGDDATDWTVWEDDKSPLVCQPVRWVRDLRPTWVALEEVPAVASLWEHFARIFRRWGYSVWTGDLCAADYGVPQTRTRRILMAHKSMVVQPPEPTHAEFPQGADLFGGQLLGWVSMATALGWNDDDRLIHPRGAGMLERHGPRDDRVGSEPAMTVTSKGRSWERFVSQPAPTLTTTRRSKDGMIVGRQLPTGEGENVGGHNWLRMGNQEKSAIRGIEQPAPTVLFGARSNKVEWFHNRTTVSRQNAEGGVRVTVSEGGVLQSFPATYPWQGSRTKQYQQVGNAIPPRLAMHVLAALGVGTLPGEVAA